MRTPITEQTILPEFLDGELERTIAQVVETLNTAAVDDAEGIVKLMLDGNPSEAVALPKQLLEAMAHVAQAMQEGLAVSIVPHATTISTQEAADILGISRPTLIRMLDANKLPYEQANRHRRLKLTDVLDYKKTMKTEREKAMDDMYELSEKLGLYDVPIEEILRATKEVRKEIASSEQT